MCEASSSAVTCMTLLMNRTGKALGSPAASWPRCMNSSTTVLPAKKVLDFGF